MSGHRAAPALLVDISAHGYGHVSQTAPVINALARRIPGLRVTVRGAAPMELLRRRITCDFRHIPAAIDFGMKMSSALDVQVAESAAAYRDYHAHWERRVQHAAREMGELRPDLLLANVPYLSLAAAKAAGIRAAAMCCLNWADIFRHYCSGEPGEDQIHAHMLAAYNSAETFLRVEPAMPMADLRNARSIAPIAHLGRSRRADIDGMLNAASGDKLILIGMGGIAYRLPVERWPRLPGVRWLVPADWRIARDDMSPFEALPYTFSDVLASCDAVLTKPGYGTFVEAACAGVRVLYVTRHDWPEEPYLVQWLRQNCASAELSRDQLLAGEFRDTLDDLWSMPQPAAPQPGGAEEAAGILEAMLATG